MQQKYRLWNKIYKMIIDQIDQSGEVTAESLSLVVLCSWQTGMCGAGGPTGATWWKAKAWAVTLEGSGGPEELMGG